MSPAWGKKYRKSIHTQNPPPPTIILYARPATVLQFYYFPKVENEDGERLQIYFPITEQKYGYKFFVRGEYMILFSQLDTR